MPQHATKTSFKKGDKHINWKGGNYNYWHRIARQKVNATEGYIVHHKDKDIRNNNIENLEIMTQSEHVALHNKERTGTLKLNSIKYLIREEVIKLTNRGYSSRKIAKILNTSKNSVLRARRIKL